MVLRTKLISKTGPDYAKGNSYIGDKAQAKEQLSGKGADQDIKQVIAAAAPEGF